MRGFLAFLILCAPLTARAQAEVEVEAEAEVEVEVEAEAEVEVEAEDDRPVGLALTLGGDDAAAAETARAAVAARLEEDGLRLLSDADLSMRVSPSRVRGCADSDCALAIGREVGASLTVGVTAWGGEEPTVTVTLLLGPGRSFSATEAVRGGDAATAARDALASAQSERRRALLVGGVVSRSADEDEEADENVPILEAPAPTGRSLEQIVLPTILGVLGLAAVGVSVYAMVDEQCSLRGPVSGVCLRGNGPNYGVGGLLAVAGGLSIAGAILWFAVGGSPPDMGNIDVVIGPGGAGVRGRF